MMKCLTNYDGLTHNKFYPVIKYLINGYVIKNDVGNKIYCKKAYRVDCLYDHPTGVDIMVLRNEKLEKIGI